MKYIKENKKSWKVLTSKAENGNVVYLDYDGYNYRNEKITEQENFIFEATLVPDSFYRGRSAAGFTFKDLKDGASFTMRIAKVEELMQAIARQDGTVKIVDGGFKGLFTFVKQGANYSISVYTEKKK